jgi:hypothetical protein
MIARSGPVVRGISAGGAGGIQELHRDPFGHRNNIAQRRGELLPPLQARGDHVHDRMRASLFSGVF